MILPDVNVLVYAHRQDSSHHSDYLDWLTQILNSDAVFGISDLVLSGFHRIVTDPRVFRDPTPLHLALQMIRMDTIDADSGLSESSRLSQAYFQGFDEVRLKLKEQWILNQFSQYNHPGWDLSPFGYITKTIRDKEFFAGGDVPGHCIIEASLVNQMGRQYETIPNQRGTST